MAHLFDPLTLTFSMKLKCETLLLRMTSDKARAIADERLSLMSFSAFYLKDECRGLTQETCDISPVLTEAMEALQDRPVLYK